MRKWKIDRVIIEMAIEIDACIISMDKDFWELIYKNKLGHKGILLLRLEDAIAEENPLLFKIFYRISWKQ